MMCKRCSGLCSFRECYDFNEWYCLNCGASAEVKKYTDFSPLLEFRDGLTPKKAKGYNKRPDPIPGQRFKKLTILEGMQKVGDVRKFLVQCTCGKKIYKSKDAIYKVSRCIDCWNKRCKVK